MVVVGWDGSISAGIHIMDGRWQVSLRISDLPLFRKAAGRFELDAVYRREPERKRTVIPCKTQRQPVLLLQLC